MAGVEGAASDVLAVDVSFGKSHQPALKDEALVLRLDDFELETRFKPQAHPKASRS